MILGIDASNLRAGGGVTHLIELLRVASPQEYGFEKVLVWCSTSTGRYLEDRSWLRKIPESLLDRSLPFRQYWQRYKLDQLVHQAGCDLLYTPGGSYTGNFRPVVTMSRNMLPFEWVEARRYGTSWILFRLWLLRWLQSRTFRQANGVIFLTRYACTGVMKIVKSLSGDITIIPHGIDEKFLQVPREQLPVDQYSEQRPFRILYVSIVDVYKHQWQVVDAVDLLWKAGFPVHLDLVGPAYLPALKRLKQKMDRIEHCDRFIRYHGSVPYADLPRWYQQADLFVFASSCENMPNILLEGMASGLPVACSNKGPMPEILGDAGVYFDPEKPQEIADAIKMFLGSACLRIEKANAAYQRALAFSWQRCADETFRFLSCIAQKGSQLSTDKSFSHQEK